MPRPGPRPYDCVKRAWHSELHSRIRGILIQEICRIVDEVHGCSTKKNKEYQEKLPIVMIRAEAIIYSKANSQAEYLDLKTLWERTNDAIDTIVRRDKDTETGSVYLRPCIEAALSVGCSQAKGSRTQRNNQQCYLSRFGSSTEEVPKLSLGTLHQYVFDYNNNNNVPSASKKQCVEHQAPPKLFYPGYPLYYGSNSHTGGPGYTLVSGARNLLAPHNLNSSSGGSQSFITNKCDLSLRCGGSQSFITDKCDLSLRLGPLSVPSPPPSFDQIQETGVRNKLIVGTSHKGKQIGSFKDGNYM